MVICITLDDVIRAKTKQVLKIYKKYVDKDFSLDYNEMKTNDLMKLFPFTNLKSLQTFLYKDYPFEIFGEAETTEKMVDKNLNLWYLSLLENDDIEDIEIVIGNPMEFNASIGYTCFFLSKIATRVRKFYFPTDSKELWDVCDVMITADNSLIENKKEGKKCIKIKTPYNKDCEGGDMEYDSLTEIFDDKDFIKKIYGNE